MSHTPHELVADFPEYVGKIQTLKANDAHFAKLCDAYHDVNRQVHRAETDVEPAGDLEMETMRRERVRLKDEIFALLRE